MKYGHTANEGARRVAAALGVCVGISGIDHGIFEIMQGNHRTSGLLIPAIGPEQQMWVHGTEDAFTLVPNYLATGILSVIVGVAMIVWSSRYVDQPNGSRVFLWLGLVLFLVGGGAGMTVFLLFGWLVARRIDNPPSWWGAALPSSLGSYVARSAKRLTAAGFALYAVALEIAIVGYVPGISDPGLALSICWLSLLGMLLAFAAALFGSCARERLRPVRAVSA